MTMPGGGPMPYVYIPLPPAVTELRLNDQWLARWSDADTLPVGAPVTHVYALLYMDNKGYVFRPRGTERWGTVEGEVRGERAEQWLKREVPARTGATVSKIALVGFLECRPTKFNEEYPPETIAVRPLYIVVAKKITDVPDDSPYERRRLPLNEHLAAMRNRYPEIRAHMDDAAGRYVKIQVTGEA